MEPNWDKIREGLKKYKWLKNNFNKVNVETDPEFQRLYNGFYKIRQKPKEFYTVFYSKLESSKKEKPTFTDVLIYFRKNLPSHSLEASFSSKLVATLDPNLPVWDTEVLRNLKLKKPYAKDKDRLRKTIELYNKIKDWYVEHLNSKEGKAKLLEFDRRFPNSGISDIKKIDLILWQTR